MSQKKTVLVVDDSAIIINRLNALISRIGNVGSVLSAKTYAEAVTLLEEEEIHVALLDIHLKGKSGIELLKFIREKNLPITVLMLTNQAHPEYKELCDKLGADHFLDKSKDFAQVPIVISSLR
ncbi:MAG: response regulator [Bacteroidetes bacterium]|nr:response regulator [Bacteroidota bacterium]